MANIYLRGRHTPIIIDDKKAEQLQSDWNMGRLADIVKVGDVVFSAKELKSVEIDAHRIRQKHEFIDINDENFKEEVKKFEKSYFAFLETYPKLKGTAYNDFKYFESLGVIKINCLKTRRITVLNVSFYSKLQKLWSGLQLLRMKRKTAQKMDMQAHLGVI